MGIKFGEIDVSQIIENEYKIAVLESVVDWLLQNSSLNTPFTDEILVGIREGAVKKLQEKYPKSGIEEKK